MLHRLSNLLFPQKSKRSNLSAILLGCRLPIIILAISYWNLTEKNEKDRLQNHLLLSPKHQVGINSQLHHLKQQGRQGLQHQCLKFYPKSWIWCTKHSLIRVVLIQSCSAGAEISPIMYFVIRNSVALSKILKIVVPYWRLFAYVDYYQNSQFYRVKISFFQILL